MKIEIEEVLKIIRDKQARIHNKICDLSYKVDCYPINDNPQNEIEYNSELSLLRELTAAFIAMGEVYTSVLAMKRSEEELKADAKSAKGKK